MGGRSEDYHRFAEQCLKLASATDSQQTRALLLHMAQVWVRLAEQNENAGADPKDEKDATG
jgi:hypothetical protein